MIFPSLIRDISNLQTLYIELFIASLFGILSIYFYLKQKKISNSQDITKNQEQLTDQIHQILKSWKWRDSGQEIGAKWALHIEIRYLKENLQQIRELLRKGVYKYAVPIYLCGIQSCN